MVCIVEDGDLAGREPITDAPSASNWDVQIASAVPEPDRYVELSQRKVPVGEHAALHDRTRPIVGERRNEIPPGDVGHCLRDVRAVAGRLQVQDDRGPGRRAITA